jgi:hypothetical protein
MCQIPRLYLLFASSLFILIGAPFSLPFSRKLLHHLLLRSYFLVTPRSHPTPDVSPSGCPRVPQRFMVIQAPRTTLSLSLNLLTMVLLLLFCRSQLVYTKHPVVYGKPPECSASRRAFPNLNLNLVMMVLRLLFRRGHLVYTKHPVVYGKPPECSASRRAFPNLNLVLMTFPSQHFHCMLASCSMLLGMSG